MKKTKSLTISVQPEFFDEVDRLGVLLGIPPGTGQGKGDGRIPTNRSEAIQRAVSYAHKAAAAGLIQPLLAE